jgi:hypothetical protein
VSDILDKKGAADARCSIQQLNNKEIHQHSATADNTLVILSALSLSLSDGNCLAS